MSDVSDPHQQWEHHDDEYHDVGQEQESPHLPASAPLKKRAAKRHKPETTPIMPSSLLFRTPRAAGAAGGNSSLCPTTIVPAWRLDPANSLSDFTIQVQGSEDSGNAQTTQTIMTCHVHKYCLVFGEQPSEYFTTLFRNNTNYGSANVKTEIPIKLEKQDEEKEEAADDSSVRRRGRRGGFLSFFYPSSPGGGTVDLTEEAEILPPLDRYEEFREETESAEMVHHQELIHRITLEDEAARAFPAFLDFLYTGYFNCNDVKDLSAEMAVALLHLGGYFGVPSLLEEMKKHVLGRLRSDNLQEFLPWIIKFQNERGMAPIYLLAKHLTAEAVFEKSSYLPELGHGMDATFITSVLEFCNELIAGQNLVSDVDDDCSVSVVAAHFLAAHKQFLSRMDLENITSTSFMPQVAPEVALQLLEIESDFCGFVVGAVQATSLQKRCVNALMSSGHDAPIRNPLKAQDVFKKLSKPQLAELLVLGIQHCGAGGTTTSSSPAKESVALAAAQPHHIKVVSTNTDLIGSYELYNGGRYLMHGGEWKGQPAEFCIWRADDQAASSSSKWRLGYRICTSDVGDEEQSHAVLYTNSRSTSESPPAWGWRRQVNDAKAFDDFLPPVFLLFCEDDSNDNNDEDDTCSL